MSGDESEPAPTCSVPSAPHGPVMPPAPGATLEACQRRCAACCAAERIRFPMDNADLEDVLDTVRSLVRDRVVPREAEIDETDEMPAGLREEAARMGLFGF